MSVMGAALVVFLAVGCQANTAAVPEIRLRAPADGVAAAIDVVGLRDDERRALQTDLTREQWSKVLRVAVGDDEPAMLGDYAVTADGARFTPRFPLDPGREYVVTFTAAAIPGVSADATRHASGRVGLPAVVREPSTTVAQVFPTSDVVPENQLRLYVHFSAPMGFKGGLDYIRLVDEAGRDVVDPFLPLDAEFWNADRTRYTVFFDPGRQKRGILPNQQMGRSLEIGRRYSLVVSRDWIDANGLPLKSEFRKSFQVGPADERPIDVKSWRLSSPAAGSRDPLIVSFPEPLDHGLLLRALGVTRGNGQFLDGEVRVDDAEQRWTFTPRVRWRQDAYHLTALAMLEDLAGNRIGRAFEVDQFDRADRPTELERTSLPFTIASR